MVDFQVCRFRFTDCSYGDMAITAEDVEQRRTTVVSLPWTWLDQVHGNAVVTVGSPGEFAGTKADASVTSVKGAAVAIQIADCAPIALLAPGAVGVVHAGWRGLASGIVGNAVEALRKLSDGPISAVLGPCIHSKCYEFSYQDLQPLVEKFGQEVRCNSNDGALTFDLPAAVKIALARSGVETIDDVNICTACSSQHWSHRKRGDRQRQALVAWLE